MQLKLLDCVAGLSRALDLVSPAVVGHHARTAAIACEIGRAMRLAHRDLTDLRLAGLMHDVGAFSLKTLLDALRFDTDEVGHADAGWRLLRGLPGFGRAALVVRRHHTPVRNFELCPEPDDVLVLAGVLCLADRVDILVRRGGATEVADILSTLREMTGSVFLPQAVEALTGRLAYRRGGPNLDFWHDAAFSGKSSAPYEDVMLAGDEIPAFTRAFSHLIDFRSRFTATHSRGVAEVSESLGLVSGFDEPARLVLRMAGDLHDLGKLAVPGEYLEKPAKLSDEEMRAVQRHAAVTSQVLSSIPGFEAVAEAAGNHHERMDGSGYPRGIAAEGLGQASRIVAIADIFTALTEERPYRQGMSLDETESLLRRMTSEGALDPGLVSSLLRNLGVIDAIRRTGQAEARSQFEAFLA